jgi:hypothetical protein
LAQAIWSRSPTVEKPWIEVSAWSSLSLTAMKLSLLFSISVGVVVVLVSGGARASPPAKQAIDDALADGEVDSEDLLGRGITGRTMLRTAPGGETWVSLVGFTRRTITDEREVGGFIVVGLPFDRIARSSSKRAVTLVDLPSPDIPRPRGVPVVAPSPEGAPELSLTPRLARASVGAAWRVAGLGADDDRLDGIVSRARWSAVLPEARIRAVRFEDERLSADTGTDSARWRDSAGANVGLEARLTWRLDRLLYADDEPSFERMRLERRDARSRIAGKVLDCLFHWQRALLDLRTLPPGPPDRERMEISLRVLEAEAALDVLTGGWFTATVKSPRGMAGPPPPNNGSDL